MLGMSWGRGALCVLLALVGMSSRAEESEVRSETREWWPGPAPGSLDPSFGSGGKVVTDFSEGVDEAYDIAVQRDGKLVAVGYANGGLPVSRDFAIARYLPDGRLDASFGTGGKVLTDFFGGDDMANAVVVQNDGKIVVAGVAHHPASPLSADFALARYNPDGSLDTSFGSGGKVATDFSFSIDVAEALAIQPNGRIVVAGASFLGPTSYDFAVVRYRKDGRLDTSFGTDGKVRYDFFGGYDSAAGVAVLPGCRLIVGGTLGRPDGQVDFGAVRLHPDGSWDTSFGTDGVATADYTGLNDVGRGMALQSKGGILVAGWADNRAPTFYDFGVVRFDKAGHLDSRFGSGGKAAADFFFNQDIAEDIAVQDDERILVAGTVFNSTNRQYDMGLARFDRHGALDLTFGTSGRVVTDFEEMPGSFDGVGAVIVQPDGAIVLAGGTGTDTDRAFAIVRYIGGKARR